jgi:hypothetical protein
MNKASKRQKPMRLFHTIRAVHSQDPGHLFSTSRHFQFRTDMHCDLCRIVIHEMPNPVMRNPTQAGPFPQRSNRRLTTRRENPARAQPRDISQGVRVRSRLWRDFHTVDAASTHVYQPASDSGTEVAGKASIRFSGSFP